MFEEIIYHRWMINDSVRVEAYQQAINQVVKPGDVVLEVGCGSGILSFFAVQAGAAKVYAIERNLRLCREAKELAKHNGLDGKIHFLAGKSTTLEPPEKADVIISELIGIFGIEENMIGFKGDARDRFLKPGGRLLPVWLKTFMMPVEAEKIWTDYVGVWKKNHYGYDFSPVRKDILGVGHYHQYLAGKSRQLAAPVIISEVNTYSMDKTIKDFKSVSTIAEDGVIHGLGGYFEAGLTEDVILSTAMDKPETCWMQAFYPLLEPLEVLAGDELRCNFNGLPRDYMIYFDLDVQLFRNGRQVGARRQHNLPLVALREKHLLDNRDFKPVLALDEVQKRDVLNLCNGANTVADIAARLLAEHPDQYRDHDQAAQTVAANLAFLVD